VKDSKRGWKNTKEKKKRKTITIPTDD
jgi:hypothetical protein